MTTSILERSLPHVTGRDPKFLETDKSAVRAIAQAAINVELFTIPLYMVALYSIQGTHQINAKGIDYYKGRLWPGAATTAKPKTDPKTDNEEAFNIVFSVFVEEMLHLQMAANLAKAIGVQPSFTSSLLQNENHGWTCYGNDKTLIPHVIDLRDTTKSSYGDVKVKLDSLNEEHIKLFLAIEQTEQDARGNISQEKIKDYFPEAPFANWKDGDNLPMFGTIGWLYECYASYLRIEYSDGSTLWSNVYDSQIPLQQDMFNNINSGHPKKEFPNFEPSLKQKSPDEVFNEAIDMMSAITDQGEGSTIHSANSAFTLQRWKKNQPAPLEVVQEKYRPSKEALEADYPSYTDTGKSAESADAEARYPHSDKSHYERFYEVQKLLGATDFVTWDKWHDAGNQWTAEMLKTSDYAPPPGPNKIPTPDEVATALNNLKQNDQNNNYTLISQGAVGAIAGITTVLDDYWQDPKKDFPYPSMVGSGDRVSICWAIFGQAPDLSRGMEKRLLGKLYHACQGLDIENPGSISEAPVEVFHSCRGSNQCKAEGGCGFAQLDSGGGLCSAMRVAHPTVLKGGEVSSEPVKGLFSAPGDNKCSSFGGCAVPISASQLYPKSGEMQIYDFDGKRDNPHKPELIGKMSFQLGDNVYDKAWEAYTKVMQHRQQNPGEKPTPSDLRVALPPST